MDLIEFARRLPKAELHVHLEGTLEPRMLMALAHRNRVDVPFNSVEEVQAAYRFGALQDFLDIYYQGMRVLCEAEDFAALTTAYVQRALADGCVHVEVFYDPQGHTARGVPFEVATDGILTALEDAERTLGVSSKLIMCVLRHLPQADGLATLALAEPYIADGRIAGIGLDSSEQGHPPEKFRQLFDAAGEAGLRRVAHAGEEGPPGYVEQALDLLGVDRIDHGNRALEDPALVRRLARLGMPLTVCPLSNVRLCNVREMSEHPLKRMLDAGLKATVNSDDPAYFGGYLLDNFAAVINALGLDAADIVTLARNSIEASFIDETAKLPHLGKIDEMAAA